MDSATRAAMEIEAPIRAKAVVDLIESTLGIKIGPTEITQAALSLSHEEKRALALTLWEAQAPPSSEELAGVHVLTVRERDTIRAALHLLQRIGYNRSAMHGPDMLPEWSLVPRELAYDEVTSLRDRLNVGE